VYDLDAELDVMTISELRRVGADSPSARRLFALAAGRAMKPPASNPGPDLRNTRYSYGPDARAMPS
jgi:hypothetical protein